MLVYAEERVIIEGDFKCEGVFLNAPEGSC